jgi:hypothetical protein
VLISSERSAPSSAVDGAVGAAEQRISTLAARGPVTGIDCTRPLLLGYVREHFLMTAAELARMKQHLVDFAAVEGFTLRAIFVEQVETAPAAFQALIEAANRYQVSAVVVPSLTHLTDSTTPTSMKDHLEHYTGARVMVACPQP